MVVLQNDALVYSVQGCNGSLHQNKLVTMKITIDTKEDSGDDIRKVIRMLQSLVGESTHQADAFSDTDSEQEPGVFNMFDAPTEDSQTEEEPKPEKIDIVEYQLSLYKQIYTFLQ